MDILIASGYHSCGGQAGATRIIIGALSLRTLLKTFGIMQNGENQKSFCGTNFVGSICCLTEWMWPPRKLSLDLMR